MENGKHRCNSLRQAEMVSFHPNFEQNLMAQEALKFRSQFYDNSVAYFNHREIFRRTVSIASDRYTANGRASQG